MSVQVALHGIEVVSAHSLERLGDTDPHHLEHARQMGHVLCTYDADFLRLAADGMEHSGILFAAEQRVTIGAWLRHVRALYANETAESLRGRVLFPRPNR